MGATPIDLDRLVGAYYDDSPDPSVRTSASRSAPRDTAAALGADVQRGARAGHQRGGLPLPRGQGSTARCSWGATRTACPSRPSARSSRCSPRHGVDVMIDADDGFTPTPAISHAILTHNRGGGSGTADGIVVTPSHNPPEDGGFKYNPPNGGPAGTEVTAWIEREANELLDAGLDGVPRAAVGGARRRTATTTSPPTSTTSPAVVDLDAIRASGLRLGVDPLGGASLAYWAAIAERHGLDLTIVNDALDPTFSLRAGRLGRQDPDGLLLAVRDGAADRAEGPLRRRVRQRPRRRPARDRHALRGAAQPQPPPRGVRRLPVRRQPRLGGGGRGRQDAGEQQHHRPGWRRTWGAALVEVPVGFKWFVDGLLDGTLGFGGEESAGASFLRRDGIGLDHRQGRADPLPAGRRDDRARRRRSRASSTAGLAERFGEPVYRRVDVAATPEEKAALAKLSAEQVGAGELAGEPILDVLTAAPGNGAPIGGVKVIAENGWFAARPSGTEDVYKTYAESFLGAGAPRAHPRRGGGHRAGRPRGRRLAPIFSPWPRSRLARSWPATGSRASPERAGWVACTGRPRWASTGRSRSS